MPPPPSMSKDNSASNFQNFLVSMRPEEVDEVINDVVLYTRGYSFFYAVDTFDIINHYLPYINNNLFDSLDRNANAQKAIAYDQFFKNEEISKRLVVLDEYKSELERIKNFILKQMDNTQLLRKNINVLNDDIEKMRSDPDSIDNIRKNFELILTFLLL